MDSAPKKAFSDGLSWNSMLLFGAFLYGSHVVLLNICKVNGKIPFNSAAVVFFTELTKLLLAVLMLLPEFRKDSKPILMVPTPKQFMMFSVPAILYTVNNNLVVHIQAYVDPASFQVLSNLKIVITVILYRIILK
ncbi:probable UDP-sugar transporter SLC35A4, partial [Paramuricea clavata]